MVPLVKVIPSARTRATTGDAAVSDNYKWVALSNVTLGVLLATLDGSITLIAMPAIFRGIHLDPLVAANSFYLLWMILGFLVVTSVLIVSLGRLGDMYGRVRMYNLGFVVYTVASLILTVDWLTGHAGALYLIGFRVVQGVGAAMLLANSSAIIADAFPANQRGLALGIVNIVGVSGVFVGLVLGGLLADRLAARLPDLGPDRTARNRLGLSQARGAQHAAPRANRLVGQCDVRAGPDPRDGVGDLRHPAIRRR
jgi:MFS family permease